MTTDEAVRALYETFPYPRETADLRPYIMGLRTPAWSIARSYRLYFPRGPERRDLDILVAGCGTAVAPLLGATMPEARVVGIDISERALEVGEALLERYGIRNVELVLLPIEEVGALGRDFDFVNCHGVLHHLADPGAGLGALARVTRPDGALGVMVYGRSGRAGVYMLQAFCKMAGLGAGESDAEAAREVLAAVPQQHPVHVVYGGHAPAASTAEVADLLLHPRDRAYSVAELRELVAGSGLRLHRWMGQAQYEASASPLVDLGLAGRIETRSRWEQAAAMELFYGMLARHEVVLTHRDRPTAAEIFAGEGLLHAIPHLAAEIDLVREDEVVTLSNPAHQVPLRMRCLADRLFPVLEAVDGRRSVREICGRDPDGIALVRDLYLGDMLLLEAGGPELRG